MKQILKRFPPVALLSALLAFSVNGADLDDTEKTCGRLNGRFWNQGPQGFKLGFIMGFNETLSELSRHDPTTAEATLPYLAAGPDGHGHFRTLLSYGETVKAIDQFYDVPENLAVPIMDAVRVISRRTEGTEPAEVEKQIAVSRKWAADCGGKGQQDKK